MDGGEGRGSKHLAVSTPVVALMKRSIRLRGAIFGRSFGCPFSDEEEEEEQGNFAGNFLLLQKNASRASFFSCSQQRKQLARKCDPPVETGSGPNIDLF